MTDKINQGFLSILSKGVEMVITYLNFQKTLQVSTPKGFKVSVIEQMVSKISSILTSDADLPENELPS